MNEFRRQDKMEAMVKANHLHLENTEMQDAFELAVKAGVATTACKNEVVDVMRDTEMFLRGYTHNRYEDAHYEAFVRAAFWWDNSWDELNFNPIHPSWWEVGAIYLRIKNYYEDVANN